MAGKSIFLRTRVFHANVCAKKKEEIKSFENLRIFKRGLFCALIKLTIFVQINFSPAESTINQLILSTNYLIEEEPYHKLLVLLVQGLQEIAINK